MGDIAPYQFEGNSPTFEERFYQNGEIFWYASEFMKSLGYAEYSPAMKPIQKAFQVCMSTSIITSENLREEIREVNEKKIKDYKLSRFACYLIAMNSDTKKPQVAKAQAYFAAFTAYIHEYIKDEKDIERVSLRTEVSDHEKTLNSAAKYAGIENYAYFTNRGYMGLYNMSINEIRNLKSLPDKRPLFDYMGAEELGANIFRITQTEAKIKRENLRGQGPLEAAAEEVGRNVRRAIQDMGGTMPENLPPSEDIKHIKSDLKKTNREFKKSDKKLIEKKP